MFAYISLLITYCWQCWLILARYNLPSHIYYIESKAHTILFSLNHYQLDHDKSLHDIKSLHNRFYYSQVYCHAVIPVTELSIVEVQAKVTILGDFDHPIIKYIIEIFIAVSIDSNTTGHRNNNGYILNIKFPK